MKISRWFFRHWIDKGLHRKPGQIDLDDDNMQANIDSGMYYYGLVQERRKNPQDDMISRLIAAEIPDDDGNMRQLDDIEITGFTTLLETQRRGIETADLEARLAALEARGAAS